MNAMLPRELQVHASSGYSVRRSGYNGGNPTNHAVRENDSKGTSRCGGPRQALWGRNLQGDDGIAVVTCQTCIRLLHSDGEKAKAAGLDAARAHAAGLVEIRSQEEHAAVRAEEIIEDHLAAGRIPVPDGFRPSGEDPVLDAVRVVAHQGEGVAPPAVVEAARDGIRAELDALQQQAQQPGTAIAFTSQRPEDPRAAAEAITHKEVQQLRSAAIQALYAYRDGLVKLGALPGAAERVSNSLRALGAIA